MGDHGEGTSLSFIPIFNVGPKHIGQRGGGNIITIVLDATARCQVTLLYLHKAAAHEIQVSNAQNDL